MKNIIYKVFEVFSSPGTGLQFLSFLTALLALIAAFLQLIRNTAKVTQESGTNPDFSLGNSA